MKHCLMNNFSFSIVIPAYNAAPTIAKAIASAMQQTIMPKEIIVIDDYSTDATVSTVNQIIEHNQSSIKIILYQQSQNKGPASARNRGWQLATGDVICFLDSDDIFVSNKLEFLELYWPPNANIVINAFAHETTNKCNDNQWVTLSTWSIIKSNKAQGSSINIKRDIDLHFPEEQYFAEDLEFALLASTQYPLFYTSTILTQTSRPQLTVGGLSGNTWQMRKGELRAFRKLASSSIKWKILSPILYTWSLIKHLKKVVIK